MSTVTNDPFFRSAEGANLHVFKEAMATAFGMIDNLHPTKVMVNAGGSITIVDHGGTRMESGEASGRGVRIEIDFASEHGGRFTLAFQFHKGDTEAEVYETIPPALETIWRD